MNMYTTYALNDAKSCLQSFAEMAKTAIDAVQSKEMSNVNSTLGAYVYTENVYRDGCRYERLYVPQLYIEKLNKLDNFGDLLKPTLDKNAADISNRRYQVAKALLNFDTMLTTKLSKDQAMGIQFRDAQHAMTDVPNELNTKYITKFVADLVRIFGPIVLLGATLNATQTNQTFATNQTIPANLTIAANQTTVANQTIAANQTLLANQTSLANQTITETQAKILHIIVDALNDGTSCITDSCDFIARAVSSAIDSIVTAATYKGYWATRQDLANFYANFKAIVDEAIAKVPLCLAEKIKKATDDLNSLQMTLFANSTTALAGNATAIEQPALPAKPTTTTPTATTKTPAPKS